MEDEMRKVHRCRYSTFVFVDEKGNRIKPAPKCMREGGMGDSRLIEAEECEHCEHFKSRYIEYPIVVDAIETEDLLEKDFHSRGSGSLVRVRPCDPKYRGETFLGLMLGDLPMRATVRWDEDAGKLTIGAFHNPAILLLDTREVVWGCESWWSEIDDPAEIGDITDAQIAGQPYMRWFLSSHADDQTPQEGPSEDEV